MSLPDAAGKGANASPSESRVLGQRFPRSRRLRTRRQFLEVYAKGSRVGCSSFTLFGLPNDVGHARLGITVTRKFGGAVMRNRAKRVLRDLFRRNRAELVHPVDLIINAHRAMARCNARELENELLAGYRRLTRRMS